MFNLLRIAFRNILLDRVSHAIFSSVILFLFIPVISSLSMQQAVELSISLSLSLFSFILLLLSVFLGGTSLWRDIERRYTFSVLSLPISRNSYIWSKFFGVAAFLMLVAILLGFIVIGDVWLVSKIYPPARAVVLGNVALAMFFLSLKYLLLTACTFLISSFSTSFFLPIFGAISIWLAGGAMQHVRDYVLSPQAKSILPIVRSSVTFFYYILPNFSAFDFGAYAVYGLQLSFSGLTLTVCYFLIYIAVILTLTSIFFSKRELK